MDNFNDEELEILTERFHDLQDRGYYCHNREMGHFNYHECCHFCLECPYFHK